VDTNYYKDILKVTYAKASKTPPYKTIQDTPANFIDDYLIIVSEIDSIIHEEQQQKKVINNG